MASLGVPGRQNGLPVSKNGAQEVPKVTFCDPNSIRNGSLLCLFLSLSTFLSCVFVPSSFSSCYSFFFCLSCSFSLYVVSFSLPSFISFLCLCGLALALTLGLMLGRALGQARWRGCPQGSWIYIYYCTTPGPSPWLSSHQTRTGSACQGLLLD